MKKGKKIIVSPVPVLYIMPYHIILILLFDARKIKNKYLHSYYKAFSTYFPKITKESRIRNGQAET